MLLTKLRKHNPAKLFFFMSVMLKIERIVFICAIPFPVLRTRPFCSFCFRFSKNGCKNAAESTLYLWVLPAADHGHKNNTPFECATTERHSIHERLPENGTTTKRSYTPIIVCTRYAVLRHDHLIKSSHIYITLLSQSAETEGFYMSIAHAVRMVNRQI